MLANKKIFALAIATILFLTTNYIAFADTIKLKDGSIIKGKITNFKEQQFTVLLGDSSRGSRRSQLTLYMDDVESIEFDGNTSPTVSVIRRDNVGANAPDDNRNNTTSNRGNNVDKNNDDNDLTATTSSPNTSSPISSAPTTPTTNPRVTTVNNSRRPTTSSILNNSSNQNNSNTATNPNNSTASTNPNNSNNSSQVTTQPVSAPRQTSNASNNSSGNGNKFFTLNAKVLADSTSNGWTNSGLVVRKGQRIRISSTGRASLGNGNFTTPSGIGSIPDKERLMPTEPTGALIAVIGDDNNDFIYVGSGQEFVAKRDGTLFLGINESNLDDNSGAFDTVIEAEATGETASSR